MRTSMRGTAMLVGAWSAALAVNRSLRRVRGRSMAPTLEPGDLLLTVPVRSPRRGEVVVLRDPRDPGHAQIKRVVGLPGEQVAVRGGRLLIDGRPHRESYDHGLGPDGALSVPPGHVAVLGDNRGGSTDSRAYGPVPLELVDRRAVLRVAPRPVVLRRRPTRLTTVAEDRRSA